MVKGTDNTHSGEVLSRYSHDGIEPVLHLFVNRHGVEHYAENDRRKQRNRNGKDYRRFWVNRERHDNCADNNERRAQKKPQKKIDRRLHLVNIRRQPCDKS